MEVHDLTAGGHAHSLSGAPGRFLAATRQLCRGQRKAAGGNRLATFLGDPDHSVRADCYVLHDARTGPRDWEGKNPADILRSDACAGSVKAIAKMDLTTDYTDGQGFRNS